MHGNGEKFAKMEQNEDVKCAHKSGAICWQMQKYNGKMKGHERQEEREKSVKIMYES